MTDLTTLLDLLEERTTEYSPGCWSGLFRSTA